MKREDVDRKSRFKWIYLIGALVLIFIIIIPLCLSLFCPTAWGNVALIPIEGLITVDGSSYLGQSTASSTDIVKFIQEADANSQIKVILLEINSPGGSAVASDEIAAAIKKVNKPTISLIREVGASGGYWVASAADHVIANRMSITGSIGVISSYLEFSGLMDKYGVGYERLVAGENKDLGVPYEKLSEEKRIILQKKLDKIQDYFIKEVSANRNMNEQTVKKLATGEFYLGVEALNFGLIDQLGDKNTAEGYLKQKYKLETIDYLEYKKEASFLEMFTGIFSEMSFNVGKGLGAIMFQTKSGIMLI